MNNMSAPKRLYRSRNRWLAGVCGGIADYMNLDPTIIRVLWIVFALAYGVGILAYIVAWLVIPQGPN
jgi:phage shock protein PspC (stress-responsive transcriptional regulator)